jgi:hypothetical protein
MLEVWVPDLARRGREPSPGQRRFLFIWQEYRMPDNQDSKGQTNGGTLAVIAAAVVLVLAMLAWGPWNTGHVASNPGPSGTAGSTAVERTPPPAESPSGNTTGSAR